jgi:hypothetical protein
LACSSATEIWKEDKTTAERKVDYIFEDEKITEGLKKRLERLSEDCYDIPLFEGLLGSWLITDQYHEGRAPGYKVMGRFHFHDSIITIHSIQPHVRRVSRP